MIIIAIHSFMEKQRYNQLHGLWQFPGTRFELIAEWRAGRYPLSRHEVLDASAMPPRWAERLVGDVYVGTYTEMDASITEDRKAYYAGLKSAECAIEIGESLSLRFIPVGTPFDSATESFTHPVQAPRPESEVASDHLVWKCPERRWLRAFVRGDLARPYDWKDQTGDVRWIESHLARCKPCFHRTAQMSRSLPCPDLSNVSRWDLIDRRDYEFEFHRREDVCRDCHAEADAMILANG